MVLASSFDQSRFFNAGDLTEAKTLRIKGVTEELVGQGAKQETKLVVRFDNVKKGLVLNKINNRTIRGAYGDDTDGWKHKQIVLFPTMTDFGGKQVPALRVRIPLKSDPRITTGKIATVNSKTTTGKPKPKPAVEAEEPEPESDQPDFDDDVEF